MSDVHAFFATTAKGMEQLLGAELRALGAQAVDVTRAGVAFQGPLLLGYRACLWSRLANRVLLPLARFAAATPEALYAGVHTIDWTQHLDPQQTLAVDFNAARSQITHTQFGAQKVKDAIVDQFRERCGTRPSVDTTRPDLRVNVYLHRDRAVLSLDLSGDSLHRRGYRERGVAAPLKENLAAAILLHADWPTLAEQHMTLLDPMCGSATLLIEAAWIAADAAPGLLRDYWGFDGWRGHDAPGWQALLAEARQRRDAGVARIAGRARLIGYDHDAGAVRAALANIERAGLRGIVHVERRALDAARPPADTDVGLLVTNPPYGERLGEQTRLTALYAQLGALLKEHFTRWQAAVFTGNPQLAQHIGLTPRARHTLYNGALLCELWLFDLGAHAADVARAAEGAEMFANRLRKNLKTLGRWAAREDISCYRLYDADLPEYALAVDLYQSEALWVHVQEYEAPRSVDPQRAAERLRAALAVLPEVLQIPQARVVFKVRRRQKGSAQYEKLAASGQFHEVTESGCRFLVNFTDYLDTGLFLDHRITRATVRTLAKGRHFLNLFAYTGTATVYAARGGAAATTTVDMSRTYLNWAQRNLALNGLDGPPHEFIQADCLDWLEEAGAAGRRFGLIFLDPPTFSNSKRMDGTFDVQRDHVALLGDAGRLLEPDGILIFSTNHRRFKLDDAALPQLRFEDISAATLPHDFARNPRIHRCWKITLAGR